MKRSIFLLLGIGLICAFMLAMSSSAVADQVLKKGTVVANAGWCQTHMMTYAVPAHFGSGGWIANATTSSAITRETLLFCDTRPAARSCEMINTSQLYGMKKHTCVVNFAIVRWAGSGVRRCSGTFAGALRTSTLCLGISTMTMFNNTA